MNIAVLKEEKKAALEILETKKALVSGLEGKVEALRSDGSRLLAARDRLQTRIDLFDGVLEAERLAVARAELGFNKDAIHQNVNLLEATGKTLEKERANIQELGERISGIERKIRLAIASQEANKAGEARYLVNRALIASQMAGSFENFERFFIHIFGISEDERSAMRAEFETQAKTPLERPKSAF